MEHVMQNLVAILQKRSARLPRQVSYIFLEDGKQELSRMTLAELHHKACVIAACLQEKKLFQQRVLLLYPAGPDFIAALVGCLYAGVVAVPLPCPRPNEFTKSHDLITAIMEDAEAAGILTTSTYTSLINDDIAKNAFVTDTTSLDSQDAGKYQLPDLQADTIAYLQYTSGSTSAPKAAVITHENLTHSLKNTAKIWHYTNDSITLTWAPHSHVYGLICGLLVPLYQGSLVIVMPPDVFIQRPVNWLAAITKYKVTHSGGPNFAYDFCIREINAEQLNGLDLSSWKVAVNGGENIQHETLVQFNQKFNPYGFALRHFCPAYGMSELTGAIASNPFGSEPKYFNLQGEVVSSGSLLPGLHAAVVDTETLLPLPQGQIGEIWLAGKSLAKGYWRRSKETKEVFNARLPGSKRHYFRTGDSGFMQEGEIFLAGRIKDIIVIYGKKYHTLDLEKSMAKALRNFPVNHNRVIFPLSKAGKEEVILVQELKENSSETILDDIIQKSCLAMVKDYGIDLYGVILVKSNSIPKTPSGKLQRKLCQKQFLESELAVIKAYFKEKIALKPKNAILEHLRPDFINDIASVLNIAPDKIDLTLPISQYRFDSINIIKLVSLLNDKYKLILTPAILFEYSTLMEFLNDLLKKHESVFNAYYQPGKTKSANSNDIAIIGMSGIFPGAANLSAFWDNLIQGREVITEIPKDRWDWKTRENDSDSAIRWGGFIADIAQFDANLFNISPREAELIDPQQRIFLQIVWQTIEDAGYTPKKLAELNTGIFAGIFKNDYAELLQNHGVSDAYLTTGITQSMLANRISYLLDLHGPSETLDTACSSSLVAIHHAVQAIINGDCEAAIAGGVNALLSPATYLAANKAGMLSKNGQCMTFDKKANGYVRGEGAGAILLKPLNNALADHDHIYGIIKGTAVNHGGHVSSLTVPNPNAQAEVIARACRRAGIPIETINYIETHGTGTALGDPIEVNGLKKAFSLLAKEQNDQSLPHYYCGLGALKTHIGHLESAAGIAGVIKVLLAMQYKKIPGNLHFEELNPYIELTDSPFYIVNKTETWKRVENKAGVKLPLRAGVSSFGFGGTNAHVILEEAVLTPSRENSTITHPYLIALSAKTESALQQRIKDLHHWLDKQISYPSLSAISYTLNTGRVHFNQRCILIVDSIMELRETLDKMQRGIQAKNVLFSSQISDKSLAALINTHSLTQDEVRHKFLILGQDYAQGREVDWEKLYSDEKKYISLPTYPFAKEVYWLPQRISPAKPTAPLLSDKNLLSSIQQEFVQLVSAILKMEVQSISLTSSLSELGFDSIAFKELASQLENKYGIELTPSVFFTYTTIQALSNYLSLTYSSEITKTYKHLAPQHQSAEMPILKNESHTVFPTYAYSASHSQPIAIIGMHGLFPQSKDLNQFWEHLEKGHDLIAEIPAERWNWREYYSDEKQNPLKTNSKWGGLLSEVDHFDASFFNISAREADLMDPQQRLFLEVVWKTIEDAGYDPLAFQEQAVGTFVGVEFSDYQALIAAQKKIFHGYTATGNSHSLIANRVSYFLNFQGPSEVIDTACSSSLVAVNRAVNALRQGECSVAIAGGVSLMLNPDTFIITSQLGVLSPDGRCKTFDKSANGYVKGEGVAAVLLKPLDQAQQDGDKIYGLIKGTAVNHGGKAQSLTAPNALAQSQLLIKAYTQAGIDAGTVSYIEAHGTGTELGDPIEIEGLKQAFKRLMKQDKKGFCGLGSVKTNIGHLEPASGIAGMLKVLLAMQHAKLPGILHFKELNPYIDLSDSPFYIVEKTQSWQRLKDEKGMDVPRRAGVSSFGFGGTNAHVVLEEYVSDLPEQHKLKPYYLITLSARHQDSLNKKMIQLGDWLNRELFNINLENLSYTLNTGRSHFNIRCALVVSSLEELKQALQALTEGRQPDYCIQGKTSTDNIYGPVFKEIYQATIEIVKNSASVSPETYREKLFILADLYTRQFPLDWNLLHANEVNKRLSSLPVYPFLKQRYWFDTELQSETVKHQSLPVIINAPQPAIKADLQGFTLRYLQRVFAEKLRLTPDQIGIDDTYEVYGVDSLLGLEITNRLETDFGTLPKTLLYEKNQISELAVYLQKKFKSVLLTLSNSDQADNEQEELHHAADNTTTVSETTAPFIMKDSASQDIAIIGLSGIFPQSSDMNMFWDNLVSSKDCITEVPIERWNYKDYPVMVGGEEKFFKYGGFIPDIDQFDPLFFNIAPRDAALMDPQERLFLQSVWTTLEDAGYTRESLRQINNKVGVFAGVTYNFYPLFIAEEWFKGNRIPLDVQSFSIANRVSYFLNLNGPSYVIDTACSSSLAAIHLACESIARGECVMSIAGGVNLSLHPCKYHMLGSYSFMSDQGRCASFAEGGSGYVPSEGVGSILLKPLELAIKDRDRIYGVIKSSSMNHGGKTSGYTVPNPNAQADLVKSALSKANIDPRTISYIEAHGTGTSLGDPIEIRGLQEAFEEYTQDKQFCAIGSVKSNIGHLESAAGISQLAKVLLQMQHKKLVPSIHSETLNPFIDFSDTPFFVQKELSDWQPAKGYPRRAGISSFGAGGSNVHLIVEEFNSPPAEQGNGAAGPFLFILSAQNPERLKEYAQKMYQFLLHENTLSPSITQLALWLSDVCYTLQTGRENMPARLAILAITYSDLLQKLNAFIEQRDDIRDLYWFNHSAQEKNADISLAEYISAKHYDKIAESWINGNKIAWKQLYAERKGSKVYLPTYPFAKRRCWIPTLVQAPVSPPSVQNVQKNDLLELPDFLKDWLYSTRWENQPLSLSDNKVRKDDHWLVFSDKETGLALQEELGKKSCTYCFAGNEFKELEQDTFQINDERIEDYQQLFSRVFEKRNRQLKGIIYLWHVSEDNLESGLNDLYSASLKSERSHKLLALFQAVIQKKWENKLTFFLITRDSQTVMEEHSSARPLQLWQHYLWSLTRIFAAEQSGYQVLLLDMDNKKDSAREATIISQELQHANALENHVAYRNSKRYVIRLSAYFNESPLKTITAWRAPQAAMITGGLGALGSEVAKFLVNNGSQYLLLTGSTPLPEPARWPAVQDACLQEKIMIIQTLEKMGATITYKTVDVTDKIKMEETIKQVEQGWQKSISGVFHLAGITTDNVTIADMSPALLQNVLAVKMQGALILHDLFKKADLSCFVLFSSIASLPYFGMSGLSAYAMANEFLNGLAAFRRRQGLPATSVSWAAWADKGMSFRYNHSAFLEAVGMETLSLAQGIEIMRYLLALQPGNVGVFKINWNKFLQVSPETRKLPFFTHFSQQSQPVLKTNAAIPCHSHECRTIIIDLLAQLLGLDRSEIDADMPYQNYGLDSIIGINFVAQLNEHFPDGVSPMDLYRYPTINQLVEYITPASAPTSEKIQGEEEFLAEVAHLSDEQISQLIETELAEINILH